MIQALSTAASGGRAMLHRIDAAAHNLANARTTAFKRSRPEFAEVLGGGARLTGTLRMTEQGPVESTGRALDLAIDGEGFFRVRRPETGEILYTRSGHFLPDSEGRLATPGGAVLEPEIRVAGLERIVVGEDGRVSGETADGRRTELGRIVLARVLDAARLEEVGPGLYRASEIPQEGAAGRLRQGHLEGSNVDVIRELTDLVAAHRALEINGKLIEAADEALRAINGLRRSNG
ncbi:MAG TPA: flagellar hook-basal body complex protein [Planctomycetota bacterium]|nr:flagellar hook-basal body complex protein [Planctomycetota bacterium]